MREPKIKYEMLGSMFSIPVFECDECGGDMGGWFEDGEKFICPDCAFKKGLITDVEYMNSVVPAVLRDNSKAIVHDGEIYIAFGKKPFSFEMTNGDYRKTKEYREWRAKVFERDNFTCKICGQVGGDLNAHHIKTFKDYPALRFTVSNGITLCEKCHREVHKRMRARKKRGRR